MSDYVTLPIADELAIRNMFARYGHLLDSGDARGWANLFTEDASWTRLNSPRARPRRLRSCGRDCDGAREPLPDGDRCGADAVQPAVPASDDRRLHRSGRHTGPGPREITRHHHRLERRLWQARDGWGLRACVPTHATGLAYLVDRVRSCPKKSIIVFFWRYSLEFAHQGLLPCC